MTCLFNTQEGIRQSATCSPSEVLVLPIRDRQASPGVTELICEAKANCVGLVASSPDTHVEIVRLDVTMDEIARMDVLDTKDLQIGNLEAKLVAAKVEEVLEEWIERAQDHCIVVARRAEPPDKWSTNATGQARKLWARIPTVDALL
ncbi:hypothetical protein PISMIDRAFT_15374 [Pisolithus microcarpus 441]|uniref:Uncharacterized protein n=1 Tax=Pisolithus microcarpus 441 TaxID=765257 RepID=A0A0C9ZB23_9AGAM|nr:hypothetical protein PISMIDRAFT_15374 [Pisolithus microcarpus 441]